ncbi:MAG: hypothetical protein CSA49_00850 [Gammaproteobacteria bacterium]|nr:MAG: hypothetical protein CSA49_00850 [Gammaproteobacteria bacterium]
MEEQLLTKCPHCGTAFRLSKEHLEIAGGAVRCGSCYQVFHAKENIIKASVVEKAKPQAPAEQETSPDPLEEPGLKDGAPYAETTSDWPTENNFAATQASNNLSDTPKTTKDKSQNSVDESWAEALLEELGDNIPEDDDELIQDNPEEDNPHATSDTGFDSIHSSENAFVEGQTTTKKAKDSIDDGFLDFDHTFETVISEEMAAETDSGHKDEAWAQKMLEELEAEESPKPPSMEELSILDNTTVEGLSDNPFSAKELSRSTEDAVQQARTKAKENAKKQRELEKAEKSSRLNSVFPEGFDAGEGFIEEIDLGEISNIITDEFTPTPSSNRTPGNDILEQQIAASELHFGDEKNIKKRSRLKAISLVFLNIIAILGLIGQHAYFNFDELAREDAYRPLYKLFCDQLGCQLPTRIDTSKIQGTNLVVRSHPMEPNAIVIDVIAYNRAKYSQPYPDLKLAFEDLNGKPVASRRFRPQEYIQDQNIDLANMPPNTPVHISLEIIDPGPQASNYQVEFLPQT